MDKVYSPATLKELDTEASFNVIVEPYLPEAFRVRLEEQFYAQVSKQARLEQLAHDPEFFKNPMKHIALFTDHGVVHVRDVALQALEVLSTINGKLIPWRDKDQLELLKAYSLQLVYLHDIGMANFSQFGRFMHPEFAAQYVFSSDFDEVIELLWAKNAGNIPWLLTQLFKTKYDEASMKVVYREMLSLSAGHSKSKVPINVINNPSLLRKQMLNILSKPLQLLFFEQKLERLQQKLQNEGDRDAIQNKIDNLEKKKEAYLTTHGNQNSAFIAHYQEVAQEAFEWLTMEELPFKQFTINIQDSIRCIRTADALRQRGTVLRTSAGYEIFIDRKTANAIYALRNDSNVYLLEGKKSVNSGEANLASSELDAHGNLRVSFHLGVFDKKKVTQKAARNAALTINDIQADTLQSFKRDAQFDEGVYTAPEIAFEDLKIVIETTKDNPAFSSFVSESLKELNPAIAHRIKESVSLYGFDFEEVKRYLNGDDLCQVIENKSLKATIIHNLAKTGHVFKVDESIPGEEEIRLIHLHKGQQLIRGGASSGFVYFPFSTGLRIYPLGGYESRLAKAWLPIGNTGVIRGSIRNADVYAEKNIRLICVPRDIYLNHWYKPLSTKELFKKLMVEAEH
ncbi:MAG: hypothetical protein ACPGJS_09525 [Flammeovirgaceae bacterium]